MQSHEFTFWGPWTNETHCHFISSALKTPLWDENIPDSGYIKYIIGPKPDCQLGNIYLLKIFLFLHSTGFHSGPFQDHSSPYSGMALFHWNKWQLEWQFWQGTLPKIIPPDSTGMTRFQQESQGHDKDIAEIACFRILSDIDTVGGWVKGSLTSKKYMHNNVWSLISYIGAPSWFITLSPVDINHPLWLIKI